MDAFGLLVLAAVAFVGSHFLLSHPLRAPLVRVAGDKGFSGIYALAALVTFVWMVVEFRATPASAPLWPVEDWLWALVTAVMLIASILFMGSLVRNPALPNAKASGAAPEPKGVFTITRHPMMWGFALWGLCHIAVYPIPKNIVLAGAIVILALLGAALQDVKKEKLYPEFWRGWEAKTGYWPFQAVVSGKARLGNLGLHALLGGVAVWLLFTWLHMPSAGVAAGIWRWV